MQLIALKPSVLFRRLRQAVCGLSLLVAAGLAWLAFEAASWQFSLLFVCAACGSTLAVCLAWRASTPAGVLRLRREGFCEWLAIGDESAGQPREMVVSGAFAGVGWLIVRLAERGGHAGWHPVAGFTLVLAPDAAPPEELRQLRVWLNLAAPRADLNSGGVQWS